MFSTGPELHLAQAGQEEEGQARQGKGLVILPCSTIQQSETRLLLPAGRGTDK